MTPSEITINDKAFVLPQDFRFLHVGGDAVYVADDQGSAGPPTNERKVTEGEWINSDHRVSAVAVGTARLLQFSSSEPDPAKAKPKSSKKSKSKKG